ncbi:C6 transcription factor [Botrytis cinerea]
MLLNSMSKRRAHTKSSNGCTQCKRRRVKCDETRPSCAICARRSEPCSYLSQPSSQTQSSFSAGSSVQSSPTALKFEDDNIRALELRLMHQYSTSTSIILSKDSRDVLFYCDVMVKHAIENTFLLHAVLTSAAIHLSTVETEKSQYWVATALQYHNRATVGLNEALQNYSSASDAIALCSLTMVINSLSLSTERFGSEEIDPVTDLIQTRKLLQGVTVCLDQIIGGDLWGGSFEAWRDQLILKSSNPKDTIHRDLLTHIDNKNSIFGHMGIFMSQHAKFPEYQTRNDELLQIALHKMNEMATYIASIESEHKSEYLNACTSLFTYTELLQMEHGAAIVAWPLAISDSLMSLLLNNDDIAMLIFMHYGVALYISTMHSFSKGAGKHLVERLSLSLEAKRPEWIEVLLWARASVSRGS